MHRALLKLPCCRGPSTARPTRQIAARKGKSAASVGMTHLRRKGRGYGGWAEGGTSGGGYTGAGLKTGHYTWRRGPSEPALERRRRRGKPAPIKAAERWSRMGGRSEFNGIEVPGCWLPGSLALRGPTRKNRAKEQSGRFGRDDGKAQAPV